MHNKQLINITEKEWVEDDSIYIFILPYEEGHNPKNPLV